MDNELRKIHDFLGARPPFDQLPEEALARLTGRLGVRAVARDAIILSPDTSNAFLYVIRAGAVEIRARNGELLARLGEGDVFGQRSLLGNEQGEGRVHALEETVLYRLPAADFRQLCQEFPQFAYHFGPIGAQRLREALHDPAQADDGTLGLMTTPVADLVGRAPVTLAAGASIREAARTMSAERVSSLLLTAEGKLRGIVTDRDLRNRAIAEGLSYEQPVEAIMTPAPLTVTSRDYAFEALIAMVRNNVHHLPVVDGEHTIGVITSTDLVQRRSASALYLLEDIRKCDDREGLVQASKRLPQMLLNLVEADASAHSVGHVVSSVGQAITCRLLALAEQRLGPPPVPYAWLVGGSQARLEQSAHSDQDNCLLLSDDFRAGEHGGYFEALGRFVCDALNACGYVYCPGDVMAVTPRWRVPLSVWRGYFDAWIDQPKPEALINASVFFDLLPLHGDQALFDELQAHVLAKARANRIFIAFMAANALQFQPPLGFFRHFVLIRGGEHDHTLDLKRRGIVPIIDLARVYALASGTPALNTQERLEAVAGQGELSHDGAADLRDALEFIASVRLRHQARQIKRGQAADNYVPPEELSHFERNHLKDAFAVVRTMQSSMAQRYQASRFG